MKEDETKRKQQTGQAVTPLHIRPHGEAKQMVPSAVGNVRAVQSANI